MVEPDPIDRLRRRLTHPSSPEFTPWDDPVAGTALQKEATDIAVAGGLARHLASGYALVVISQIVVCHASWDEPGGPPPPDRRDPDPQLPALMFDPATQNGTVGVPMGLVRKTLRWTQDNLDQIASHMRVAERTGKREQTALQCGIFETIDRNWRSKHDRAFKTLVRMFT